MRLRDKKSGILLHITSLPSPDGIGTFGKGAYAFVDFLHTANQRIWQILPLNVAGRGNSPYSSPSSFAGNHLLIDLECLCSQGLLEAEQLAEMPQEEQIDFKRVLAYKLPLLSAAAKNFDKQNAEFLQFCLDNSYWLNDYAVFSAAVECFGENTFDWPLELRHKNSAALEIFCAEQEEKISETKILQFFFYRQWQNLKNYANQKNIKIIGDIPFYVAADSADVWAHPELFRLGKNLVPTAVAGVPPDYFSPTGQLWGNPLYNWQEHRKTHYDWWCRRFSHCKVLYDIIRIDHFRAFADYYAIPFGAKTARNGVWEHGVGFDFFVTVGEKTGSLPIIAEDLGEESPLVTELLAKTGFPGMKILQFGFSGREYITHLPKNVPENCVYYTGTHDNETLCGWYENADSSVKKFFNSYLPGSADAPTKAIKSAMKSKAATVIVPLQDYLNLGNSARMNLPGSESGNWGWRCQSRYITAELAEKIKKISQIRNK